MKQTSLPFALTPVSGSRWITDFDSATTTALPQTDLFIRPGTRRKPGEDSEMNAPMLLGHQPDGDFQFSARVKAELASTFDAGALVIWVDDRNWAKLCFEYSPSGERTVVSVVTRDVSDDANSFAVDEDHVWLRISRLGNVLAFHASFNSKKWMLVRVFELAASLSSAAVGFVAQCPMGDGCRVDFDQLSFTGEKLLDLRDGS